MGQHKHNPTAIASTDIQKRYNTYNELFWKVRAKRGNDTGD